MGSRTSPSQSFQTWVTAFEFLFQHNTPHGYELVIFGMKIKMMQLIKDDKYAFLVMLAVRE